MITLLWVLYVFFGAVFLGVGWGLCPAGHRGDDSRIFILLTSPVWPVGLVLVFTYYTTKFLKK